jgi:hypothetical protein
MVGSSGFSILSAWGRGQAGVLRPPSRLTPAQYWTRTPSKVASTNVIFERSTVSSVQLVSLAELKLACVVEQSLSVQSVNLA